MTVEAEGAAYWSRQSQRLIEGDPIRQSFTEVYGWLTKGFDTVALGEARNCERHCHESSRDPCITRVVAEKMALLPTEDSLEERT